MELKSILYAASSRMASKEITVKRASVARMQEITFHGGRGTAVTEKKPLSWRRSRVKTVGDSTRTSRCNQASFQSGALSNTLKGKQKGIKTRIPLHIVTVQAALAGRRRCCKHEWRRLSDTAGRAAPPCLLESAWTAAE